MFKGTSLLRLVLTLCASLALVGMSFAAHINTNAPSKSKSQKKVSESSRTRHRMHRLARSRSANVRRASLRTRRHHSYERFHMRILLTATSRPGKIPRCGRPRSMRWET